MRVVCVHLTDGPMVLLGWIENPTPDRGYERILDLYVESKRVALNTDTIRYNSLCFCMALCTLFCDCIP